MSTSTSQLLNGFIQKSFGEISNHDNYVYSPMSIYYAMTMIYHGMVESPAKQQLAHVLGLDTNSVIPILLNIHSKMNHKFISDFGQSYESKLCNGLFIDQKYPIHQQYIQDLKSLNAAISNVKFPEAITDINSWVSDATNKKINSLLQNGDLNDDTFGVLVNTIYFKSNWASNFDSHETHKAIFHRQDTTSIEIDMMHNTEDYGMYYQDEKIQVWEKSYTDGKTSMGFMLPKHDVKINFDDIDHIIKNLKINCVESFIPKFKCETRVELKSFFEKMGTTDIFVSGKAGLTEITSDPNVYINNIIHQAVIEIDEKGTEAAAATSITVRRQCIKKPEIFRVDRTFGWYIRHCETGIMFTGLQNF